MHSLTQYCTYLFSEFIHISIQNFPETRFSSQICAQNLNLNQLHFVLLQSKLF